MELGTAFPLLEDPGPTNRRDNEYTGRSFPQWGDVNGDFGKVVILRMEAIEGELPKDPFLLRKSVEAHLGAKVENAYPEARGISYVLKVRNKRHVDKLLELNQLSNGFGIKISKHPILNYSKCVISCAESTNYSDEDLKENLKDQGVTGVRRIMKRSGDTRINTPTIILTLEGTVIPQHIDFGWIRCKTRPFYPSPMLCYACFEFGHTRLRCQHPAPICGNCSGQHEVLKDVPCTLKPFCKRCRSNDHQLSSRKCPTYMKEEQIQHIRVDSGISYPAAKRAYEQNHNSRSLAAIVAANNDQRFDDMKAKLDQVLTEMGKKDEKIESLLTEIQKRETEIAKKDERIRKMEAVLKINPQDRLDVAQKHGTVPDLIAKVKSLEAELASKNREIASIIDAYPTNDTTNKKAILKKQETPKPTLTTQPQKPKATSTSKSSSLDSEHQQTETHYTGTKKKIRKQDRDEKDPKRLRNDLISMYISDTEMEFSPTGENNSQDMSLSSGDERMAHDDVGLSPNN